MGVYNYHITKGKNDSGTSIDAVTNLVEKGKKRKGSCKILISQLQEPFHEDYTPTATGKTKKACSSEALSILSG
ncbi:hypothetical protein, partial [Anaerolinea sp.]|uniref:hypothetical protein n=1 Tax=Anaerolinea sp. TaxID=1872519 RepID=UPI002ACE9EC8